MGEIKYSLWRKVKMASALVIVFLLVYTTNRLDSTHFEDVQTALNSVYEDRLVAKAAVYDLSNLFHQKHLQLLKADETTPYQVSKETYAAVDQAIATFSATKLTPREERIFSIFQEDYLKAKQLEGNFTSNSDKVLLEKKFVEIQKDLNELAQIQMVEGDRLRKSAQESLDQNAFFAQIEVVFLIIIGLLLQFLIFYR